MTSPSPSKQYLVVSLMVGLISAAFVGLGTGYRHLWQDEVETAERARIVLESGYPRVMDRHGNLSLNASGLEIEEGFVHRYTPWLQFYAAAAGLWTGDRLGLNRDRSVRLPFVVAHGVIAGLVCAGNVAMAGVPVGAASAVALLGSLQTEPVLYHRTARYHALLDMLVVMGLLGCGAIRLGKRWGWMVVTLAVVCLPHVQSFSGSLFSSLLVLTVFLTLFHTDAIPRQKQDIASFAARIMLPWFFSLLLLACLTRPWAQHLWGRWEPFDFSKFFHVRYRLWPALAFALVSAGWLYDRKRKKTALNLLGIVVVYLVLAAVLNRYSLDQFRYHLPLVTLLMWWPIAWGLESFSSRQKKIFVGVQCLFLMAPELTSPSYSAYQGIKVVWSDFKYAHAGIRQPLHDAVDYIRAHGRPGESVLFEYVPQFGTWYLPEFSTALMPDAAVKSDLNRFNPIWDAPLRMPVWHVWYPTFGSGAWVPFAFNNSDYRATSPQNGGRTYTLSSKRLQRTQTMCIQKIWATGRWNNAPFMLYRDDSKDPAGDKEDRMILGKACDEMSLNGPPPL